MKHCLCSLQPRLWWGTLTSAHNQGEEEETKVRAEEEKEKVSSQNQPTLQSGLLLDSLAVWPEEMVKTKQKESRARGEITKVCVFLQEARCTEFNIICCVVVGLLPTACHHWGRGKRKRRRVPKKARGIGIYNSNVKINIYLIPQLLLWLSFIYRLPNVSLHLFSVSGIPPKSLNTGTYMYIAKLCAKVNDTKSSHADSFL